MTVAVTLASLLCAVGFEDAKTNETAQGVTYEALAHPHLRIASAKASFLTGSATAAEQGAAALLGGDPGAGCSPALWFCAWKKLE
jgi:hypothetical protein